MAELYLIHKTEEADAEYRISGEKFTFGRGSDVDLQIADEGLSRVNSTIYNEHGKIWIVDENSTNGTFVNGSAVTGAGTPLRTGDAITAGNGSRFKFLVREEKQPFSAPIVANSQTAPSGGKMSILPVVLGAGAVFLLVISVAALAVIALYDPSPTVKTTRPEISEEIDDTPTPEVKSTGKTNPSSTITASTNSSPSAQADNTSITNSPQTDQTALTADITNGRKYLELSDTERRTYIENKATFVAQMIGNSSPEKIPPLALDKIKEFLDSYAKRAGVKPLGGCRLGDNLQATYERASKNAPFIIKAFNEKGIDPRIGMYLAMIESEHCVCLQSRTGPLGMFQFTKATAALHGLKVFAGASPSNPDERCEPEPAARAAASYMKVLTARYGTGASSVPLAIGSYNSGEGGLSKNLDTALQSGTSLPRDFWSLIAKGDMLSKQFQAENFKYVPKFFAAAIVGENPKDFGLNLQPLSTYSK